MKRNPVKSNNNSPEVQAPKSKSIKWINTGGPLILKDGTKILHNGTFLASKEDVPEAFLDVIHPVDPIALANSDVQVVSVVLGFKLKPREGSDFVDIVDGADKRINEKDLTAEEAQAILDKLV